MATKDYENDDDIDLPDFDGYDGDDGEMEDYDMPGHREDRTPIENAIHGLKDGIKTNLLSQSTVEDFVKESLPKEYGDVYEMMEKVASYGTESLNGLSTGLKTFSDKIKRKVKDISPETRDKLPGFVVKAIDDLEVSDNTSSDYDEGSDNSNSQEDEISSTITDVFKAQVRVDENRRREDRAERLIKDKLDFIRRKPVDEATRITAKGISRLVGYQDSVLVRYQQKSLELQLRHLHVARDLLNVTNVHFGKTEAILTNIQTNTALPEIQKLHKTESIKQSLREMMANKVVYTLGGWMKPVYEKIKENVEDIVGETFGMASEVKSMDSFEQGQQAGGMLSGMTRKWLTAKIKPHVENLPIAVKGQELIHKYVYNGHRGLRNWANSPTTAPTWFGRLPEFLREPASNIYTDAVDYVKGEVPTDFKHQLNVKGYDTLDSREATYYDMGARTAIVDVIPTWLREIAHWTKSTATGIIEGDRDEYDFKRRGIAKQSEMSKEINERIIGKRSAVDSENESLVESFLGSGGTPEERELLLRTIIHASRKDEQFDPTELRRYGAFNGMGDKATIKTTIAKIKKQFKVREMAVAGNTPSKTNYRNALLEFEKFKGKQNVNDRALDVVNKIYGIDRMTKLGYVDSAGDIDFLKFLKLKHINEDVLPTPTPDRSAASAGSAGPVTIDLSTYLGDTSVIVTTLKAIETNTRTVNIPNIDFTTVVTGLTDNATTITASITAFSDRVTTLYTEKNQLVLDGIAQLTTDVKTIGQSHAVLLVENNTETKNTNAILKDIYKHFKDCGCGNGPGPTPTPGPTPPPGGPTPTPGPTPPPTPGSNWDILSLLGRFSLDRIRKLAVKGAEVLFDGAIKLLVGALYSPIYIGKKLFDIQTALLKGTWKTAKWVATEGIPKAFNFGKKTAGRIVKDIWVHGDSTPRMTTGLLKAGHYIRASDRTPIRYLKDIDGLILDINGQVILRADEVENAYTDDFKYIRKGIIGAMKLPFQAGMLMLKPYQIAYNAAKSILTGAHSLLFRGDLYLKGEREPRLTRRLMEMGSYIDKNTGNVIKSVQDITGTVVMIRDGREEVVVTHKEIHDAGGFVDSLGKRIIVKGLSSVGGAGLWAAKLAGRAITSYVKLVASFYSGVGRLIAAGVRGITGLVGIRFKTTGDVNKDLLQLTYANVSYTANIFKILKERMGKNIETNDVSEKWRTGDTDGDGLRDNSWMAKIKRAKDKLLEKFKKREDSGEDSGRSRLGSIISKWLPAIGIGIGALLAVTKKFFGMFTSVGSIAGAVVNGAGAIATGAIGVGKRALPWIIRGGRFLGQVAVRAVGAIPIPVVKVATGAVLAGWSLYKLSTKKKSPIQEYRMSQYGISYENDDNVAKILYLEKMVRNKTRVDRDGNVIVNIQSLSLNMLADLFDFDIDDVRKDKTSVNYILTWFNKRFIPVFSAHVGLLKDVITGLDMVGIDDRINKSKAVTFIKGVKGKVSKDVYDVQPNPFKEEEVTEVDIEVAYSKAVNHYTKFETRDETKKREELEKEQIKSKDKEKINKKEEDNASLSDRIAKSFRDSTVGKHVFNVIDNVDFGIRNSDVINNTTDAISNAYDETVNKITGNPAKNKALLIKAADEFGITEPKARAMFFAQTDHESGGFSKLTESLKYSADGLLKTFPKYYKTREDAERDARNEEAIAERVYGGRAGNNVRGDAYRYRGRGFIQLTHKSGYQEASRALGMDLVNNPELAIIPENAARIAAWRFKLRKSDVYATQGDYRASRRGINGGEIGFDDVMRKFNAYMHDTSILGKNAPAIADKGPYIPPTPQPEQPNQPVADKPTTPQPVQPISPRIPPTPVKDNPVFPTRVSNVPEQPKPPAKIDTSALSERQTASATDVMQMQSKLVGQLLERQNQLLGNIDLSTSKIVELLTNRFTTPGNQTTPAPQTGRNNYPQQASNGRLPDLPVGSLKPGIG